jgi:hypothetical protein
MKVTQKRKRMITTEQELALCGTDLEIHKLNDQYGHLRIVGLITVDYWVGSRKAWVLGSNTTGKYAAPKEACSLARTGVWSEPSLTTGERDETSTMVPAS